jgi:hypothetical protein
MARNIDEILGKHFHFAGDAVSVVKSHQRREKL